MRNNETGEFELVVGNRLLLSGFFLVVLLFAVAFAMGYVVGENSRSVKAQAEPAGPAPTANTEARPQPSPAPVPPPPETPAAESKAPPAETEPTAQPVTQPAQDVPQTEPKRDAPPARPRDTAPPPAQSNPAASDVPSGRYWQVTSTTNPESAQTVLEALKNKGFPASLSPGPNNFTRVLVGPYSDTAALAKAKADLENAGFLHLVRH